MADRLPVAHRIWCWTCAFVLLLLIGSRELHYASVSLSPAVDFLNSEVLALGLSIFANVTFLVVFYPLIAGLALVLALLLRKRFFRRDASRWGSHPALYSAIWLSFVLGHFFFDMNPLLGWGAAISLVLAVPSFRREGPAPAWIRGAQLAAGVAYLGIWIFFSNDPTEIASIVVWVLLLLAVLVGGRRLLFPRDRLLLSVGGIALMQGFAAVLPLLIPPPGATRLGTGMAYSFCEAPQHEKLFAVVPDCFTLPLAASWESCIDGHLAEFDIRDLTLQKRHHVLSDQFYGRMEQLTCLEDTIQIGMSSAQIDGVAHGQNAMQFEIAPPNRITPNLVGKGMGDRLAYDEKHDAIFYVGEWSGDLVRYDRATETALPYSPDPLTGSIRIMGRKVPGSLLLSRFSIHSGRDTIYLVEWLGGRFIQEMSLTSLSVERKFLHNSGGSIGLAVDEELDRIYVTGLWGMEVFDLRTGAQIFRKRLGFFSRVPVLDAERDLLYVPSTVEGRIRVFDRPSMELLGVIPIGYGTRHPHLSLDGERFFATSRAAYYYWDAEELASSFRPGS